MKKQKLIDGINEYLTLGGLFNPEMMDHKKVRNLMMEIRDYLEGVPDDNDHDYSEEEYQAVMGGVMGGDLFTIEEWNNNVKLGSFIPDDGDGYYMINDKKTPVYVWEHPAPEGTTHVIWYNK